MSVGESFTEIFSYTITDGDGNTSTATLTITITGTNDGPVANADTDTVAEDTVGPGHRQCARPMTRMWMATR